MINVRKPAWKTEKRRAISKVAGFRLHWFLFGLLLLSFALTYPTTYKIFDEVKYAEQAMGFAQFDAYPQATIRSIPLDYPVGTALLAVPVIWLFGVSGVFAMTMICLLTGLYLTMLTLRQLGYDDKWAFILLLFPPLIVLSRSFMSDIPAMMLVSGFLYLFFQKHRSHRNQLLLGIVGGAILIFREPVFLIFIPFLFHRGVKEYDQRKSLLLGLVIGLILKPISGLIFFNDPFFIKDPGTSFGLMTLPTNMLIILAVFLIFIPLGPIVMSKYRGPLKKTILFSIGMYTALIAFYTYNGLNSGLLKGMILGPRFFIPILPLIAICYADLDKQLKPRVSESIKKAIMLFGVIFFVGAQVLGSRFENEQMKFADLLSPMQNGQVMTNDLGEAYKYVNRLNGFSKETRVSQIGNIVKPERNWNYALFNVDNDNQILQTICQNQFDLPCPTRKVINQIDGTSLSVISSNHIN